MVQMIECPKCGAKRRSPAAIGAELRELRWGFGLTQQVIAKRIGVTKQYVALLEAGLRDWTPALERRYRRALR